MNTDFIWTLVGFFLTLIVLSYLVGDNPAFRFVSYAFVGVVSGYAAVLLIFQVLIPHLIQPLISAPLMQKLFLLVPLVLALLLLGKLSPRTAGLGNFSMAYLVGAGAAVAIGGAVTGTLFPQFYATIAPFNLAAAASPLGALFEGVFVLIGAAASLAYFHFSARSTPGQAPVRSPLIEAIARVGQVFIGVTLGALFAGVFSAALTALIERIIFLVTTIYSFF